MFKVNVLEIINMAHRSYKRGKINCVGDLGQVQVTLELGFRRLVEYDSLIHRHGFKSSALF